MSESLTVDVTADEKLWQVMHMLNDKTSKFPFDLQWHHRKLEVHQL